MGNINNNFEIVQKIKDLVKDIPYTLTVNCCKLPLIKIDREKFLRTELKKYYPEKVILKAIETNPHAAGIPVKIINKIADSCIEYERGLTTGIAAGLGIPGITSNAAFIGICAGDISQYYSCMVRLMQKLIYLYGFPKITDVDGEIDDETKWKLLKCMGIMIGVNWAGDSTANAIKLLSEKISQKITEKTFQKTVSKAVPILGAVINGGITYAGFTKQAKKLKNYLIGYYSKGFLLTDDIINN